MIGTTVMRRFEIEDRLGSGGFGTVYRAWDRRLERDVAVKVVETEARTGARTTREAQAAARLNHRGIVTLFEFTHHEFGSEGGRAFLVSELVEGDTVRELIERDLLSDREVAEIGADVCEALDHAHGRGVIHRDIKPANLISPHREGGAKLMDFGIARLIDADDLTNAGDVLGTLSYMAPEQAEGLPVGPSGDVFSLALTLYEAWTGSNPRRRPTPGATARAMDEEIPLLARARPDLPVELTDAVDSCLDLDPELRPRLEQFGTVLENCLPLLDDSIPAPNTRSRGHAISVFADREFDPGRIAAAAVVGGMTATCMMLTGQADVLPVAVAFLLTTMLALLSPKLGFMAAGGGLALWLTLVAGLPGAGLAAVLSVVVPAVLTRGSGRALTAIPLGPLLGTISLAPIVPVIAAFAPERRDRIVVAAAGLTVTAMAEAVTGRSLLFGRFTQVSGDWKQSMPAFLSDLLFPVLVSSTYLVALIVWVGLAVLLGAIIGRLRDRREAARPGVVAFAAVGSERVPNAQ